MALRWTFNFRSVLSRVCSIYIYDSTYTGSPTMLDSRNSSAPGYPDDDPVLIEEAHDDNLLDVIRSKTGYIRLRELQPDALKDMYPMTNDQCRIVITYDGGTIFEGYIQAQSFSNDYLGFNSKIKLPIMSYLEYLRDQPLPDTTAGGNTTIEFCELFSEIFNMYTYLVMPKIPIYDEDGNLVHPLRMAVFQDVLFPYNNDYDYGKLVDGKEPSAYSPITYGKFLEGFCHHFGFIVHDVGWTLMFTRFGWDGDYIRCDISEIANPESWTTVIGSGSTEMNIGDYFEFASDSNKRNTASPVSKLRLNYDASELPFKIDFDVCKYAGTGGSTPYNHELVMDYMGHNLTSQNFSTEASLAYGKIRLAADRDGTFLRCYYESDTVPMMTVVCPTPRDLLPYRMKMKIEAGRPLTVRTWVRSGGKYYDPFDKTETGDTWVDAVVYNDYTPDSNGNYVIEVATVSTDIRVQLSVLPEAGYSTVVFKITDIEFTKIDDDKITATDLYEIYVRSPRDYETVIGDKGSMRSEEINELFFFHSDLYASVYNYPYLRKAQPELKLRMRAKVTPNLIPMYYNRLKVFSETNMWRLISSTFSPCNDEYTLYVMTGEFN